MECHAHAGSCGLKRAAAVPRQLPARPQLLSRPGCTRHHSSRDRTLQVCAAGKGKGKFKTAGAQTQQFQEPPTPDIDPENAEFVIFCRNPKLPQWLPLSIVKGGQAANLLVRSMDSEWGRKLFGKTLIRNIAQAVYKDKDQVEKLVKRQYPPLKQASDLQYGFKVRDKTKPKSWYQPVDITILPEEKDLEPTAVERLQGLFKGK